MTRPTEPIPILLLLTPNQAVATYITIDLILKRDTTPDPTVTHILRQTRDTLHAGLTGAGFTLTDAGWTPPEKDHP